MDLGAQEEDKKMRYVPKDGDEYCFIETDGTINMTFWHTEAHHLAAWNMGNVFKNAEFTAYEATLDGDKSKVKSVIVLYDNRRRQEFILAPGYGMTFRWQDSRTLGE